MSRLVPNRLKTARQQLLTIIFYYVKIDISKVKMSIGTCSYMIQFYVTCIKMDRILGVKRGTAKFSFLLNLKLTNITSCGLKKSESMTHKSVVGTTNFLKIIFIVPK